MEFHKQFKPIGRLVFRKEPSKAPDDPVYFILESAFIFLNMRISVPSPHQGVG